MCHAVHSISVELQILMARVADSATLPPTPQQSHCSSIDWLAEALTDPRRNGKGQSPVSLHVQRPSKSPGGGGVGEQVGLKLRVCRPDSTHLLQRLGSCTLGSQLLRTAMNVFVQKAPSDASAQAWRERRRSFWVQGEAAFYKYIAYNLANPSSIMGSTVGMERGQNKGQQKFPLKK